MRTQLIGLSAVSTICIHTATTSSTPCASSVVRQLNTDFKELRAGGLWSTELILRTLCRECLLAHCYIYNTLQISSHPHSEEERYGWSCFLVCGCFGAMGMKKYEALVSKVFYFVLSTTVLAMLGVFSFVSSTIPLPKSHSTLFATVYELVVMARSTRMLVFMLFHIIMVMICYGSSSKSHFESELDSDVAVGVSPDLHDSDKKEEAVYDDKCDENVGDFQGDEEEDEDMNVASYDADDESFDIEDEEEGHGDLRGRIEEFIGNVTRTWKEELLKEKKLLCLVEDTESLYMLVPYEMV